MDWKKDLEIGAAIIEKISEVAPVLAQVFPASAGIISAITLGTKIATGLVHEVPVVMQTFDDIKAAASGGRVISADEWSIWEAEINTAHSEFVAAAQQVAGS